jgi:hypothetical protein
MTREERAPGGGQDPGDASQMADLVPWVRNVAPADDGLHAALSGVFWWAWNSNSGAPCSRRAWSDLQAGLARQACTGAAISACACRERCAPRGGVYTPGCPECNAVCSGAQARAWAWRRTGRPWTGLSSSTWRRPAWRPGSWSPRCPAACPPGPTAARRPCSSRRRRRRRCQRLRPWLRRRRPPPRRHQRPHLPSQHCRPRCQRSPRRRQT